MDETSFKPVSGEVLNRDFVLETSQALSSKDKVALSSETVFESNVGFLEAVKMTGKNKGTLSKDSKSGKLPFTVSETGQKLYKVSDLYSLYGFCDQGETRLQVSKKLAETRVETDANIVELAILRERLRAQQEMLSVKDAQIRDLQISRDKLLEQNNRFTMLLPSQASISSRFTLLSEEEPSLEARKPWWKKLFS